MKGPTHELVGVSTAVATAQVLHVDMVMATGLVGAAYVSSRLPDRLEGLLPHRTVTHWGVTAVALTTAIGVGLGATAGLVVALVVAGGFAIGYGMHLVADMCTPHGLAVAMPFSRRKCWLLPRALRIRTGSTSEGFFAFLVAAALAAYMAMTYVVTS